MQRNLVSASVALIALGVSAASPVFAQSTIYAYLSGPNTQYAPSGIPNTTVETFNNLTEGNQTGTYTSPTTGASYTGTFNVHGDDDYGSGTGNYFTFGAQSNTSTPVTLKFASPITYFGLSYQAGDEFNGFTFYDGSGNLIGRYSTATLTGALNGGSGTVTTLDGTVYNTSQYYGKPNGQGAGYTGYRPDANQPFSFVNFFTSPGTTISQIVFDNSGTTASGFESDNHTISTDSSIAPPTHGDYVPIGTAGAPPPVPTQTPDASTLALVLGASPLGLLGVAARRRRK